MNKYVDVIETESHFILWLKLNKNCLNCTEDIIFGIVYVPPNQSKYFSEDEFDLLKSEITQMCKNYDCIYLCGDINAQTGKLPDYTTDDWFLSRFFDFDEATISFYDQKAALECMNIQIARKSQDKKKNNIGYKLMDFCKITTSPS